MPAGTLRLTCWWSHAGTGLGAKGQGIAAPVQPVSMDGSSGLGFQLPPPMPDRRPLLRRRSPPPPRRCQTYILIFCCFAVDAVSAGLVFSTSRAVQGASTTLLKGFANSVNMCLQPSCAHALSYLPKQHQLLII